MCISHLEVHFRCWKVYAHFCTFCTQSASLRVSKMEIFYFLYLCLLKLYLYFVAKHVELHSQHIHVMFYEIFASVIYTIFKQSRYCQIYIKTLSFNISPNFQNVTFTKKNIWEEDLWCHHKISTLYIFLQLNHKFVKKHIRFFTHLFSNNK